VLLKKVFALLMAGGLLLTPLAAHAGIAPNSTPADRDYKTWNYDWYRDVAWYPCCNLVPAVHTDDPQLNELWTKIHNAFMHYDLEIRSTLTKSQANAFAADDDDLHMQNWKTRCLNPYEVRGYIAFLSQRLQLAPAQEDEITRIEWHMMREVMPWWHAYCERYDKWLVERYHTTFVEAAPQVAPPDNSIPYAVHGHAPPPTRKIKRNKDIK
jgi:hypothetical protein